MASSVTIKMNRSFLPQIRKMVNQAIKETAMELRDEIKLKVSVPFPPSSRPGMPPRKRSGGLKRAIFAKKIKQMDWVVGVKKLESGRENLGIWLEGGTGRFRKRFPVNSTGSITGEYSSPGPGKTSMQARPFLLGHVITRGPRRMQQNLRAVAGMTAGGRVFKGSLSRMTGR